MGEINRLSLLIISAATRLVAAFLYIFANYILQFMEFERKYFVMSKKNSTFVAERRRRRKSGGRLKEFHALRAVSRFAVSNLETLKL